MSQSFLIRKTFYGLLTLVCGFYAAMECLESLEQSFLQTVEVAVPPLVVKQDLPLSAQFKVKDRVVHLEVARSATEREIGLMGRDQLPSDRGMLFIVEPPRKAQIWMRGMKIPLDLIFVRSGIIQAIVPNVPPCKTEDCPLHEASSPIDRVLEIGAGQAAAMGLKVGDRLEIAQSIAPSTLN